MQKTQETTILFLGQEESPGGGRGSPFQCSCLENPMDRAAWWATVHGVTKRSQRTRLKQLSRQTQHTCSLSVLTLTLNSICYCLVTQSCPTLCNTMDCSPPGSSVHGFSRQEYWSGLPFFSPRDLSDPRIKPEFPAWQVDSLPLSHGEVHKFYKF